MLFFFFHPRSDQRWLFRTNQRRWEGKMDREGAGKKARVYALDRKVSKNDCCPFLADTLRQQNIIKRNNSQTDIPKQCNGIESHASLSEVLA